MKQLLIYIITIGFFLLIGSWLGIHPTTAEMVLMVMATTFALMLGEMSTRTSKEEESETNERSTTPGL